MDSWGRVVEQILLEAFPLVRSTVASVDEEKPTPILQLAGYISCVDAHSDQTWQLHQQYRMHPSFSLRRQLT